MTYKRYTVRRGNELAMSVEIESPDQGYKIHFYVGDSAADIAAGDTILAKHTGQGIAYYANIAEWVLNDADIALLPGNYYPYVWHIEYETPLGNRSPVETGTLEVVL